MQITVFCHKVIISSSFMQAWLADEHFGELLTAHPIVLEAEPIIDHLADVLLHPVGGIISTQHLCGMYRGR